MLTKHDFQIFTKKSLKRRNEPQQFIVNKLLTGEQILADNQEKIGKKIKIKLQLVVGRSEGQLTV